MNQMSSIVTLSRDRIAAQTNIYQCRYCKFLNILDLNPFICLTSSSNKSNILLDAIFRVSKFVNNENPAKDLTTLSLIQLKTENDAFFLL